MILSLVVLMCLAVSAPASGISNPAATFCASQGGTYFTIAESDGQRGICKLADGQEVDAWSYFRDSHSVTKQSNTATNIANPAATFCIAEGGSYSIVDGDGGQRGVCTFAGGRQVDAWEYFREKHK